MKSLVVSMLLFMLLSSLKPGESSATLTCSSTSGRTLFVAELPECNYLGTAKFSVDTAILNFGFEDHSNIIFDPENKAFTIAFESRDEKRFLKFWAIPTTIKKIKSKKGTGSSFHDVYEFKAKIYATEPRIGFANITKTIELNCTLYYEL